jgi:signal transduction histidine kinase
MSKGREQEQRKEERPRVLVVGANGSVRRQVVSALRRAELAVDEVDTVVGSIEQAPAATWDESGFPAEVGVVCGDGTGFAQAQQTLCRWLGQPARGQRLLLALSQAAQAVQRVQDPHHVYQIIARSLAGLGFFPIIYALSEDGQFLDVHLMDSTDGHADGGRGVLRLPVVPGGTHQQILSRGQAALLTGLREPEAEILSQAGLGLDGAATAGLDLERAICTPLKANGDVLGLLVVYGPDLTEEDLPAMSAFANQAAIAVRTAQLLEREREQREVAEALQEAARLLSSTLDLDEVLDRILEQVERVVAGDTFNIMLIQEDRAHVVRWRGYERLGAADWISTFSLPIAAYPNLRRMVETGHAVVVEDTASDPRWVGVEGCEWLRSLVAAPIRVGNLTVGFLNVDGTRACQFSQRDAQRLEAFASHAAIAVENARLYEELRGHAEQLEERVRERTAQVEAHNARLEAVLSGTTDGVVVLDGQGRTVRLNPVAEDYLNRALAPEDRETLRASLQELAAQAAERPRKVLELDGTDLELNAVPIPDHELEGGAALVTIHDVTHLKELARLKSRFVSNVSHELRTPITTIRLYAELLRHAEGAQREEYLDALNREAERQTRLVEDILQISHLDAGRLEIRPSLISLNDLTEIAAVTYGPLAAQNEIDLRHQPSDAVPPTMVDPDKIMQVLNNLVENAIRYTPAGGEVIISTGREESDGQSWARVAVSDTGMGIPPDELPHIFERFFRGQQPQQMMLPGSGLGLAIVKEIVALHRGRVSASSQVGQGTTLTVWLPAADGREPAVDRNVEKRERNGRS